MKALPSVVLLLLFMGRPLDSQTPGDQRSSSPRREVLAQLYIINEITAAAQRLHLEARNYRNDTGALWGAWTSNFGIRGGTIDWAQFQGESHGPAAIARAERLQSEIFRLETGGRQVADDADVLVSGLGALGDQWERARGLAQAGAAEFNEARVLLAKLRAELSRAAQALNALDVEIRDRQQDYDRLYPRFERFIYRQGLVVTLPRPWHRNYALSNQPRLLLRYDFEQRYEQALMRAQRELDAPGEIRRSGS